MQKMWKSVEQNTQYAAAASLPKEVTKRGNLTHWPGLFNENFVKLNDLPFHIAQHAIQNISPAKG